MADGDRDLAPNTLSSIILVTYNSSAVIAQCLVPLRELDGSVEVILADNNSADDTVSIVEKDFPFVTVLRNTSNLGFAKAVNGAVQQSHGSSVTLLNPDAILTSAVFAELLDTISTDDTLGVVAPVVIHPDGRLRVLSAGRFPSAWRMFCHYFGLSRLPGRFAFFEGHYALPSDSAAPRDVDWVTGACFTVGRATWDDLGGLSEKWFMYAEDIEFCYRVKRSGRRVSMHPSAVVKHLVGGSTKGEEFSTNPAWVVNLYDFYGRDIATNGLERITWKLVVAVGLFSRGVIYAILSWRGSGDRKRMWRIESKRFFSFARSLMAAQSRPD